MICRKCNEVLDEENVHAIGIGDDDDSVDLIIECHACGHVINAFVKEADFVDVER